MPCSSGAAWGSDPEPNRDQKIIIEHRTVSEPAHVPPYQPYTHMPCTDTRDNPREDNRILQGKLTSTINLLEQSQYRVKYLEACLCALINETLLQMGQAHMDQIFKYAEENGKVNLKEFWEQHKSEDIERLKSDLEGYSEHEKALLLGLLQKK